jgi:hypothetical protein
MWRYCGAAFFLFIGALEIILALNKRVRDEILKNSPGGVRIKPLPLVLAALSAFAIAFGLLFFNRFI